MRVRSEPSKVGVSPDEVVLVAHLVRRHTNLELGVGERQYLIQL